MEELVGPEVEVVLKLKEATDLSFVNGPVFAVATFSDNQMNTDVFEGDNVVTFNTDLVWETNKQNIKKMRNSKIPIKLTLFKYVNEKQHEKIGYVVVTLKTAQYEPKGKVVRIKEEYVKVLGLGKEAKGCTPLLCLSLRIRDKVPEIKTPVPYENIKTNGSKIETCGDVREELINDTPVKELSLLEGPPIIQEMGDVEEIVSIPLPSETLLSPPLSSRSPRTKHNIKEDRQSMMNADLKNSLGDLQPQKRYVEAYHNFNLQINLERILWYKVPQKYRFRFQHSRSEILSTAHPEIQVPRANESLELCDIKATFSFVETPAEFFKLLDNVPPLVSVYSSQHGRPFVIAREPLRIDRIADIEDEKMYEIELTDIKSHEVIAKLTYTATLKDCGPQVTKDVTLTIKPEKDEEDLPPAIFGTMTDKIVDELEDWKERQKQLFRQKFTKKFEKEMAEFREEWMEKRREQEEILSLRMERCRVLGNSLIMATEDVKQKNLEYMEKEKNLEITKSELELRYLKLLTEKNEEADKLKGEYFNSLNEKETKIARLEAEKNTLETQIKVLQNENAELRAALRENESEMEKNKRACLSQEQTATLLQDLKTMQEKMEASYNSKLFFKEQWGRAVREIHRIKSEYAKNIKVQLQYRKDELKKLGLEQLFNIEKNKNSLERDDMLEAKDFLPPDFDAKNSLSDVDFFHNSKSTNEVFKTNMDIVKESNTYLLKFNQESEEKLKRLIEERNKLLCEPNSSIDDERIVKLNKEIRHLLDH